MTCPLCGYFMDRMDVECKRCHGQGLAPSKPSPAKTQALPPRPVTSVSLPATTVLDDNSPPPRQVEKITVSEWHARTGIPMVVPDPPEPPGLLAQVFGWGVAGIFAIGCFIPLGIFVVVALICLLLGFLESL